MIRDYGCRILVIFSSLYNNEGDLILENENGESEQIDAQRLINILSHDNEDDSFKLNLDIVFVNVLNGTKIAEVFKKLGVA